MRCLGTMSGRPDVFNLHHSRGKPLLLTVARGLLPDAPASRRAALREYFCDKDAEASASPAGWQLTLTWPTDFARHVDPRLEVGLAWWGGGASLGNMALQRRRSGRLLRALHDSWTLNSWSEWALRHGAGWSDKVTVLHVDDHRDLGSPRLFLQGRTWVDAITGNSFDFGQPDSVAACIESGALGIGSFMTPFLHAAPQAQVRHLCQAPKATGRREFVIDRTTETDTLLELGATRQAMELTPRQGASGPGIYVVTPSVMEWLDDVGAGPLLLHVDMDYFNNRYDGDSDWAERTETLDPSLGSVLDAIDRFTEALRASGVAGRLADVVVAFSPGFFPAEFWAPADAALCQGLELDGC